MRDAPLSYTAEPGKRAGTTILKLVGPLTLFNLFDFQSQFRAMKSPVLIVDLSAVEYIDSAGLGLLMNGYVSARNAGHKLLLSGVNDRVRALFQVTRVDHVLAIFPSVEAAEDSL